MIEIKVVLEDDGSGFVQAYKNGKIIAGDDMDCDEIKGYMDTSIDILESISASLQKIELNGITFKIEE